MNDQIKYDEIEVDIVHLAKLLCSKAWIIVVTMILLGAILFSYAMFFVTPLYQSSAMMYVNNSFNVGSASFSISSSELTAAKSLLDVYVIILKTRLTLEHVIDEADLDYTYEELYDMVKAESVNDTEIFKITVTSEDPAEAELIVNTIVEVLPDKIADVVDGSSVRLVDHAVYPTERSSPSYTKYAVIGMILGFVLSCAVIIIIDLMDTTVRSEDYLSQKYGIPVLAVVPDAAGTKKNPYGYYQDYAYYKNYSSVSAGKDNNI